MKKIFFPLMMLSLVACNNTKTLQDTTDTLAQSEAVQPIPVTQDTLPKTDAISSATSRPNEVLFNGILVVPPECQATITVLMGGTVKNTHLLSGMTVRKGQVLVTLENPEFIDLQQNYLENWAQLEYLEAEYNRQQTLSREQAASKKKFQQSKADYLSMKSKVQAAAAQLHLLGIDPADITHHGIRPYLEVKSPINGYIGNVRINPGKHIAAGETICEVINKEKTMLRLVAYEKDLAVIHNGAPVEFTVNGIGTKVFRGTLMAIGQQVDEVSRSLEIYAKADTNEDFFRPGMYVTARILH